MCVDRVTPKPQAASAKVDSTAWRRHAERNHLDGPVTSASIGAT